MSFKKGINTVSVVAGILAGLTAIACIAAAFFPSIRINDEKMEEIGDFSFFIIMYLNQETFDKIAEAQTEALETGREYSYEQNIWEFAVQNLNSMFHNEEYKKVNKMSDRFEGAGQDKDDVQLATESRDFTVRGFITLAIFGIPMLLLLLGAVMVFLRKTGAADMLLVGGFAFTAASVYWVLFIHNMVPLGRVYFNGAYANTGDLALSSGLLMTAVPVWMIVLGALTTAEAVALMALHRLKERG